MDKDLLGLLIGIGLLIAFVAYMAHIFFNPDRFGWLALSTAEPKVPAAGATPVCARSGKFRTAAWY
ncbi:MAG: hypothetical protein Q7R40_04810 [Phaeospirillum sp.]|nr:hypothetical protein [Phaeospirillum sp.]